MKNIKNFVIVMITVVFTAMLNVAAFAATITPKQDGSIYYDGEIRYPIELATYLNKAYPAMAILDLNPVRAGAGWTVTADDLAVYKAKESFCEQTVLKIAKDKIKNGMSIRDAAKAVAKYYAYNYPYADGHISEYQSGYQQLMNGTGVCASNSRLFRLTMNSIPFKNGAVDWGNGTEHVNAFVVNSLNHSWNEIIVNGQVYVYDIVNFKFDVDPESNSIYQDVYYVLN